jgi:hypothetical protein
MENLNIIEILKVGLPGLVFLLALLSFNLLSKEGARDHPRLSLLKAIRNFMYVNIVLATLTLASPMLDRFVPKTSLPDQKAFSIEAKISPTISESGKATVCQNVDYRNSFLLVKDIVSQRLVQVRATGVCPCTNSKYILLSALDASDLGWPAEIDNRQVEVVPAPPGYRFEI